MRAACRGLLAVAACRCLVFCGAFAFPQMHLKAEAVSCEARPDILCSAQLNMHPRPTLTQAPPALENRDRGGDTPHWLNRAERRGRLLEAQLACNPDLAGLLVLLRSYGLTLAHRDGDGQLLLRLPHRPDCRAELMVRENSCSFQLYVPGWAGLERSEGSARQVHRKVAVQLVDLEVILPRVAAQPPPRL